MKTAFKIIFCLGIFFLMSSEELFAQKTVKFGKNEDIIRTLQKKYMAYPWSKKLQVIRDSLYTKEKIKQILSADTIYITYSWDYEDEIYDELIWNNLGQKIEFEFLNDRIKDEKTGKWMPKIENYDGCSSVLVVYFYDIMNMPKPYEESMKPHSLESYPHSSTSAIILVKRAEREYTLYHPTEKTFVDKPIDIMEKDLKFIEVDKLFNEFFNIDKVE